jgi:hypothetical protein
MGSDNTEVPLAIDGDELPPPAEPPTFQEELEFLAKQTDSAQAELDRGGDD